MSNRNAQQFAAWGFDLLKYDFCSYRGLVTSYDATSMQKPYRLMGNYLRQLDRDIVFNICEYGLADPGEVGGIRRRQLLAFHG